MKSFRAVTTVCPWYEEWSTQEAAQAAAVLHIYNHHRDVWIEIMGDRPPLARTPPEEYGQLLERVGEHG